MARLWYLPTVVVAALVLGVPLLTFLGIAGPQAFPWFLAGVGIGMLCTIALAASAAFASATARPWRGAAVRATAVPLVLTLAVLAIGSSGSGHPIHDVTTDPADTLQFAPDVAAREQMPMTREQVLQQQHEIYPGVQPLVVAAPVGVAFAAALSVAEGMDRWQVTGSDAAAGRIEATATSRIFHFVDDVVIRVTPQADGSRIDVRSRSRMGRSDLGANAKRIRAYLGRLADAV